MNKRQVIILCIIAVILAAAVAVVKFTGKETVQSATARAAGETLFENFPANEVASVAITGADGTVTIAGTIRGRQWQWQCTVEKL